MAALLRKGTCGPLVKTVQEALTKAGHPMTVSSFFGPATDSAVRAFQMKLGMLPDGIVGTKTLQALGVGAADPSAPKRGSAAEMADLLARIGVLPAQAAQTGRTARLPNIPATPVSAMNLSENGYRFIFSEETYPGISNRLHWPKGKSGVTLGPGYDMKERSESTISDDMQAINLSPEVANKIAKGAGLINVDADNFRKANHDLVNLLPEQEMAILKRIAPSYVQIVKSCVRVDLMPHEFDALVSFAYNPAGKMQRVGTLINNGEIAKAMSTIGEAVGLSEATKSGLTVRREREIKLFIYADYGKLRKV